MDHTAKRLRRPRPIRGFSLAIALVAAALLASGLKR
jgi:hypothetical protein